MGKRYFKCNINNSQEDGSMSFSNCHRNNNKAGHRDQSDTAPDQDSSNSKYVVDEDKRERKDGPGGN